MAVIGWGWWGVVVVVESKAWANWRGGTKSEQVLTVEVGGPATFRALDVIRYCHVWC